MKTFAISVLAAAAGFLLITILLRPPSSATSQAKPQAALGAAAVETEAVERTAPMTELPPAPPEPVATAGAVEKSSGLPTTEKKSPDSTTSKPSGDTAAASTPKDESAVRSQGKKLSTAEKLTLAQTGTTDTSLRNADYPRTYISAISVDLESPMHAVRLTWSGPQAASQETGPFHSSPGRGLGTNNCDDPQESNRQDSNCTPKGVFRVQGFSNTLPTYAHCKFATWFLLGRGVAFHSYPGVADYPASHGCVRLDEHAAQLIHNNAKIGATEVTVGGHWKFGQ